MESLAVNSFRKKSSYVGNMAKGRIWKPVFQESKAHQISISKHFLPHLCVSEGKKCSFFGKFDVLCFLQAPILRFTLLPHYRRIVDVWLDSKHTFKHDSKHTCLISLLMLLQYPSWIKIVHLPSLCILFCTLSMTPFFLSLPLKVLF